MATLGSDGAVQRAGIEDQRPPAESQRRFVGVAVADQVPFLAGNQVAEHPFVVAVQEGDFTAGEFQFAQCARETSAYRSPRACRRPSSLSVLPRTKCEVMPRSSCMTPGADVAAMQNEMHLMVFENSNRVAGGPNIAVGVAHHADSHGRNLEKVMIFREELAERAGIDVHPAYTFSRNFSRFPPARFF